MNNITLNIFGSKIFFNLIKEIESDYNIFFENNRTSKDYFNIKIIFAENLKLSFLINLLKDNTPSIIFLNDKNYILKNKITLYELQKITNSVIKWSGIITCLCLDKTA